MSRGPGRIERAIRELFDAHPDEAFVTDELCEHCYPDVRPIERKHQVAVLRAAWNVLKDDPDWRASRINGMGCGHLFVNHASERSYALGHMVGSRLPALIYRSPKRARRRPGQWVRVRGASWMRRKVTPWWGEGKSHVENREQLLALHAEYAAGGGPDWLTRNAFADGRFTVHAAEHVAYRDGDASTRAALEAKWQTERDAAIARGKMLADRVMGRVVEDKRFDAHDVTGNETLTGEAFPPTELSRLADKVRALLAANDPDAIRAGLAEIASALDGMANQ